MEGPRYQHLHQEWQEPLEELNGRVPVWVDRAKIYPRDQTQGFKDIVGGVWGIF